MIRKLVISSALLSCIAFTSSCNKSDSIEYTLTFDNARGIGAGAPVMMNGANVGKVKEVNLSNLGEGVEVVALIDRNQASKIPAPPNSTGRIHVEKEKLWLEILARGEGKTLSSSARNEGVDNWAEESIWRTSQTAKSKWATAVAFGSEKLSKVQVWADTNGPAMKAKMGEFMESVETATSEGAEKAEEHWNDAVDKASELIKELKTADQSQAAEDVRQSLKEMLESAEGLEEKTRVKLQEALDSLERVHEEEVKPALEAAGEKAAEAAEATTEKAVELKEAVEEKLEKSGS